MIMSDSSSRSFRSRLIVTAFCLVAVLIVQSLPVPFLQTQFASEANPLAGLTIGILGLMPYISSHLIFMVFALLIPPLRSRLFNQDYHYLFFRRTIQLLTCIIIFIQSYTLVSVLCRQDLVMSQSALVFTALVLVFTAGAGVYLICGYIISYYGIGQGISLIFCMAIVKRISSTAKLCAGLDVAPARATVVYLIIVATVILFSIFILGLRRVYNSSSLPLSLPALMPVTWYTILATLVVIGLHQHFLPTSILSLGVFLAVALTVNFVYVRHILNHTSSPAGSSVPVTDPRLWSWVFVWAAVVLLFQTGHFFYSTHTPMSIALKGLQQVMQLFILTVTAVNYYRWWQHREWKPVYIHADPAYAYAYAQNLRANGMEPCVIGREGWGTAYGLFVGPLAERFVLLKPETSTPE